MVKNGAGFSLKAGAKVVLFYLMTKRFEK